MTLIDIQEYRRTRRIVPPLKMVEGKLPDRYAEAADIAMIRRLGEVAETCRPADTEPAA